MSVSEHNRIVQLIARSRTWSLAREIAAYRLSDSEYELVSQLAIEFLTAFPILPGACVMMSAGFATLVTQRSEIPAVVVAGGLAVGGTEYFSSRPPRELRSVFDSSRLDWDGHAWALVGNHVVDLSIFRTAYSGLGPPGLEEAIITRFGPGKGAFLSELRRTGAEAMRYRAGYVLTAEQQAAIAIGSDVMMGRQVERQSD